MSDLEVLKKRVKILEESNETLRESAHKLEKTSGAQRDIIGILLSNSELTEAQRIKLAFVFHQQKTGSYTVKQNYTNGSELPPELKGAYDLVCSMTKATEVNTKPRSKSGIGLPASSPAVYYGTDPNLMKMNKV